VLEAREEYIQACLDKTDCKEASVIWDLMYRPTLAEKRLFRSLTEWLKLPRRWKMDKDEYTLEITSDLWSEKKSGVGGERSKRPKRSQRS
jgi:hypothetical protein